MGCQMSKTYQDKIKRCNIVNCNQISTGHVEGKDLCSEHADYFKEQKNKWMSISLKGNKIKNKNTKKENKYGIQKSI